MAQTLYARADQIDLFGAQLPGDLSVNTGVLRTMADKWLERVTKQVEDENNSEFYVCKT
jgi:hypothetical protein